MERNRLFFSLRWKLAILIGSVFLTLQSLFAYFVYTNALSNFERDRQNIQRNHVNLAQTLTNDAFNVLEQFADLVSVVKETHSKPLGKSASTISSLDEHWGRWQLIWDIKNITFFDNEGLKVKSWGEILPNSELGIQQVIENEKPNHQVFCPDNCYQQAIIPVIDRSSTIGVFSVIKSFADVLIKYRNATQSDIGILIAHNTSSTAQIAQRNSRWGFKLSGMTNPEKNTPVYEAISQKYLLKDFLNNNKRVDLNHLIYEVQILPIQQTENALLEGPYFLYIEEITEDIGKFNNDLKKIWFYNFTGLVVALLLILLVVHFSFRSITQLSKALPLLSKSQFSLFKERISFKPHNGLGYDELDSLNLSVLSLSDQLEYFEKEMRGHTFNLMEKSKELANERDFISQLIDLAPIIIITQKLNGIILTVNDAGLDSLETNKASVIGKVFDVFLPESDEEHAKKLKRLRAGEFGEEIQLDGFLVTETGKLRDISWLHKLLPSKQYGEEMVILTMGLDISERKIAEAKNIRMAYYDFLTGLGNRRKFQEEFAQKLASATRYGYQLALFYLDLDRFKEINDSSGHEAGDSFLKMVANALKGAIRSTDLLCRLGGDEFTLLMPHADMVGIENIAHKINKVLKAQKFIYGDKSYLASASIGIAIFPLHGITVHELTSNADLAMYKAKELGRGQFHLFNLDFDYRGKVNLAVQWRRTLEDAIDENKFILFYQAILDVKTDSISHFECLVRLQQDDGTLLMPSDFLQRAEELNLIGKIDRLVLQKTVEKHLELNRQGKQYKLNVNISKRTFEDPSIFVFLEKLFANPEVDQKRIIFEITDTASISNQKSTNYLIDKIKSLGCVLALNDFGVEYPSLAYLRNSPIDYVKMDGSVISKLNGDNKTIQFVKEIIELAQSVGKKTVAENVESEDVLAVLKELGIDYVQGYLIGKPEAME